METGNNVCALCAWHETCQKKFSISGKDMRCADFVRDLRIKQEEPTGAEAGEGQKK